MSAARPVSDRSIIGVDLDEVLHGAEEIGRELKIFKREKDKKTKQKRLVVDADGTPVVDMRKTFFWLESGYVPARKAGALWITTRRRLRAFANGEPDPSGWTPKLPKKQAEQAA